MDMLEKPVHSCQDCALSAGGRCPFVQKRFAAGSTLWMQGDVPGEVVFVKDGLVSLSASEPSGTETLTSVRGPRSLLGTEALQGQPSLTSVEALTETTVCAADAPTVQRWVGPSSPAGTLMNLMLDELARNVRDLNLRSGPSVSRVARFLLEYAKLVEGGKQAPFSKQHVARLLGMRAETLSRCLRELSDQELIDSSRHIEVRDRDRLAALARGEGATGTDD